MTVGFGSMLREWRARRRMSQLDLALEAEVSARHISFLETGRARPSRPMVLRLTEVLEAPLASRNDLLEAAGFASAFSAAPLDDQALAPVREALTRLMNHHAPYPALLFTRHWDLIDANPAGQAMLAGLATGANGIELLLTDQGLRARIVNLGATLRMMATRLRADSRHVGGDARLDAFVARLTADPSVADARPEDDIDPRQPFMPIRLRGPGVELALLSATAEIGTAQSITLRDLHLELFFPADAATRSFFEGG